MPSMEYYFRKYNVIGGGTHWLTTAPGRFCGIAPSNFAPDSVHLHTALITTDDYDDDDDDDHQTTLPLSLSAAYVLRPPIMGLAFIFTGPLPKLIEQEEGAYLFLGQLSYWIMLGLLPAGCFSATADYLACKVNAAFFVLFVSIILPGDIDAISSNVNNNRLQTLTSDVSHLLTMAVLFMSHTYRVHANQKMPDTAPASWKTCSVQQPQDYIPYKKR